MSDTRHATSDASRRATRVTQLDTPITQLDTRELLEAEIIGMQEQLAGFILDEVLAEDGKFNIIHSLPPQD